MRAPSAASFTDQRASPQPYSSTSSPATSPNAPTSDSGIPQTPHVHGASRSGECAA